MAKYNRGSKANRFGDLEGDSSLREMFNREKERSAADSFQTYEDEYGDKYDTTSLNEEDFINERAKAVQSIQDEPARSRRIVQQSASEIDSLQPRPAKKKQANRPKPRYDRDDYYPRPQKKKKHTGLLVVLIILVIIIAGAAYLAISAKAEITELKTEANVLKEDLKDTLSAVKEMDPDEIEKSVDKIEASAETLRETLDEPFWHIASAIPYYGADVTTANKLLDVLDDADKGIIRPFIQQIRDEPLSGLKDTDDGLKVDIIVSYLDFLDVVEPELRSVTADLEGVKFNSIDMNIDEYVEKFNGIFESLDSVGDYKDLLRAFIGNGEDKRYLVMAQNSAEIRASGGFPGSMGIIKIEDGKLSIGDFSSIVNFIYQPLLPEANVTQHEIDLFQYMYGTWAHDACYNPHFQRVAEITSVAYEYRNHKKLDGILSLTPDVIQHILAISDDTITLDDGTVLTGDNATRVLQRDLYIKYQGDQGTAVANNEYIDGLFAQTAKQAVGLVFKNFDFGKLSAFMDMIKDGCAERTLMLWFSDPIDQAANIKAGTSGNLNSDPENPQAGVYFSCCDPGRLGMFTEINYEISEPTEKKGCQVYTVKATFNNYINDQDVTGVDASYILGNYGGNIQSYVYFFAPAGGKVSNFKCSNDMEIKTDEYQDLKLGYCLDLTLRPDEPVTVTYKVTTAPGVTTPLTISSTHTLQEYR